MLRIRVELVPLGDLSSVRTLEVVDVANVGAPTAAEASNPNGARIYHAWRRPPGTEDTLPEPLPDVEVVHRRDAGALKLAERVLTALEVTL